MTTNLNTVDGIESGDSVVLYSGKDADFVRAALSVMLVYYQANLVFPTTGKQEDTVQNVVPLTGGSIQVTDGDDNIWLIVQPAATIATLTIVLPASGNAIDKQELLVTSTQIVTALTMGGNGATVVGTPALGVANDFFKLKYYAFNNQWIIVGNS